MKVLVEFSVDADIIECPKWTVEELPAYQIQFREWLFDKKNDHPYWVYKNEEKHGCCYRSHAFVEWLNNFVMQDNLEKATVIEECVSYETGHICRVIFPADMEDVSDDKRWVFADWLQEKVEKGNTREDDYIKNYGRERYSSYAVADWVNQFILNSKNQKAYVIEKQLNFEEIKAMPKIYF